MMKALSFCRVGRFAVVLALLWALFAPFGCSSATQAVPERSQVESRLAGYEASEHFLARMAERGVSADTVVDVIEHGERFYDPKNDSTIRWKDGVYVALTESRVIKTVIRGPIERRWQRSAGP
jgi:hypothetical protein